MFTIEIRASMIDYTINENTGEFLLSTMEYDNKFGYISNESYKNKAMNEPSEFTEYYSFIKKNDKWLLYEIESIYHAVNFKFKFMYIFLILMLGIIIIILGYI